MIQSLLIFKTHFHTRKRAFHFSKLMNIQVLDGSISKVSCSQTQDQSLNHATKEGKRESCLLLCSSYPKKKKTNKESVNSLNHTLK